MTDLKRSASFQKLRDSIKRNSVKLVQKLTGTTEIDSPTYDQDNIKLKTNRHSNIFDIEYSSKTETVKPRAPIIVNPRLNNTTDNKLNNNNNSSSENLDDDDYDNSSNNEFSISNFGR